MNQLLLAAVLATVSMNTIAASKEEHAIKTSQPLIRALVEMQLETACSSSVNERGEVSLDVNEECVSRVNNLRSTLEGEPTAVTLVNHVDMFMHANAIPRKNTSGFVDVSSQ